MEKLLWERKIWKRIAKASFYLVFFLILVAVIIIGRDVGQVDKDMGRHIIFIGILLTFMDAAITGTFIEMAFHLERLEDKLCEVFDKMPEPVTQPGEEGRLGELAKIAESERKGGTSGKAVDWKCVKCNCINPSYVTTCKCGMSKEESEDCRKREEMASREADVLRRGWVCRSCGTQNPANVFVCKCGMKKSVNNGESLSQSVQVQESVKAMRTSLNTEAERQEAEKREAERRKSEKQAAVRQAAERREAKAQGVGNNASVNSAQAYVPQNIDMYGNPYYYDQNGVPYYIAPDGKAYYYQ